MFKRAVNLTYQFQYQLKIASQEAINELLIKRPSHVFESRYLLSLNVSTEKLNDMRLSYFFLKAVRIQKNQGERTKLIFLYLFQLTK